MGIKNIAVELNNLGGIVTFDTDSGSADTTFVLSQHRSLHYRLGWQIHRSITFGSGVDDARLEEADVDAIVDAIERALSS